MKTYSEKFKKRRKFFLVIPLLVFPFITMLFWALGIGKGTQNNTGKEQQKGLNTQLPEAKLPAENMDKMSLYHVVEQDSEALKDALSQDTRNGSVEKNYTKDTNNATYDSGYNDTQDKTMRVQGDPDSNEVKVQRKLAELENTLDKTTDTGLSSARDLPGSIHDNHIDTDMYSLQKLLGDTQAGEHPDPELQQLNGMLEKILDIQHPERMEEKWKEQSDIQTGQVFPVTAEANTGTASLLERPYIPNSPGDSAWPFAGYLKQNAFYDLSQPTVRNNLPRQAIPAVIHESRTLVSGATVKLRLLKDIFIEGILIPQNTFIYGTCNIVGERLNILIKDIRYGNRIFPVSLSAYDMDGLEGIRVPGAILRDAARESTGQAVQGLQLMDMNPSLATQAAGVGIESLKGLLNRKTKQVRVTVKAGYPVLLVDEKTMHQ